MKRFAFDADYLTKLAGGDPATQEHFTSYFGELLRIKLRARIRSEQLIQDIRQETFLRVFAYLKKPGALEYPERLGAFVNSVCNNVTLEAIRGEARVVPLPDSGWEPSDPSPHPDHAIIRGERKAVVRKVLTELSDRDQRLLKSVFLEERDKDDVCQEFQVSRNYLRVLLCRARSRFRDILEPDGGAK